MDQLASIFHQLASSAASAQGGLLEEVLPAALGAASGRGVGQQRRGSNPPGIANSGSLQGGLPAAACNEDEWEAVQLLSALQDTRRPGKPFAGGQQQQQQRGGPAAQQGPQLARGEHSIDDIATQLLSAFPEFADLLQTRNVPLAPQRHAPNDHQLDAQQQLLLQQLIAGVTQQQEQEQQEQEAALTALAQAQLAAMQKQQQQQRQQQQQQAGKSLQQVLAQQSQQQQQQQQQLFAQLLTQQQGAPATDAANARGAQQQQQQQQQLFSMRGAGGLAMPGEAAHTAQRPPLAAAAGRRPGAGLQEQRGPPPGAQLPGSQPGSPSSGRPAAAAPARQHQAGADARRKQQQQRDSDAGTSSPTSSSTLQSQQDEAAAAAVAAHKPRQQASKPRSTQLSLRQRLGLPPVGPAGTALALPDAQAGAAAVSKTKPSKNNHVVCVWDLDETLILLHSLVTGRYADASGSVDAQAAADLGRKAQRLVLQLADDKMHFTQLEGVDLVHISDVWRLAAQHAQRISRRERQQQKAQGAASAAAAGSAAAGSSCSNSLAAQPGESKDASKDAAARSSAEGEAGKQPCPTGVRQPASGAGAASGESERDSSPVPAALTTCNGAGGAAAAGPDAATAAATAAAAGSCVVVGARDAPPQRQLVLRPAKPGPPPDELKALWDDIQQVYDAGSGVLPLPKSEAAALDMLYEELDAASSGWCRTAARLLGDLQAGDGRGLVVTNVVVGGSQLVPLLAKLLLFKLDGFFGLAEVYAAAHAPKMAAFKRIAAKYGPKARYIVLGDGLEEEACAEQLEWPFVRITLTHQPPLTPAHHSAARGAAAEVPQQQCAGGGAAKRQKRSDDGAGISREQQVVGTAAAGSEAPSAAGSDVSMGEAAATGVAGAQGHGKVCARTRPDALASAGHTLMELTAEQLLQLAASQS